MAAGLAGLGFAQPSQAQGVVRAEHGSWQIRCDNKSGPGVDICALMQSVTAKNNPNIGITVILQKHKNNKTILRVQAPLGVLLPGGLGLTVDGKDLGRTTFLRCLPGGCLADVPLDKKILKLFKIGKKATFVVFETPKKGIGLPVSLKGFTAGFKALPIMGAPAKAIKVTPGKPVALPPKPIAGKSSGKAPKKAKGNVSTTIKTLPLPSVSGKNESRLAPGG
ncbi:MAG TPA: invasion associated locus B family protein [Rhizobiales bacterium]|nr:invasion associated locus B family protein [Hyphomicrobiales bacterium]